MVSISYSSKRLSSAEQRGLGPDGQPAPVPVRRLVYIAGPTHAYSMHEAERNVRACESLASDLLAGSAFSGLLPVCLPSMMRAMGGLANEEEERALAVMLLRRCDALLLVHDWRVSAKVRQCPQFEVDEAFRLGIPIFGLMHEMQCQRDDGSAMASLLKWAKETPAPSEARRTTVQAAADAYRAACVQHRASFDEREAKADAHSRLADISKLASAGVRLGAPVVMEYAAIVTALNSNSAETVLVGLDAAAVTARDALCVAAVAG